MGKKTIYGKEQRTLPCKEGCGTKVPVADDAVAVTCSTCVQKQLARYEAGMSTDLNAPPDEEADYDENMTLEDINEGRKHRRATKAGRDSVPEGRGKVRRGKRSEKHPKQGGKKAAGRKASGPGHKVLKSRRS